VLLCARMLLRHGRRDNERSRVALKRTRARQRNPGGPYGCWLHLLHGAEHFASFEATCTTRATLFCSCSRTRTGTEVHSYPKTNVSYCLQRSRTIRSSSSAITQFPCFYTLTSDKSSAAPYSCLQGLPGAKATRCPAKPHLQVSFPPRSIGGEVSHQTLATPTLRRGHLPARWLGDGPVPWHKDSDAARFALIRL
jgi:hypothetical protein